MFTKSGSNDTRWRPSSSGSWPVLTPSSREQRRGRRWFAAER